MSRRINAVGEDPYLKATNEDKTTHGSSGPGAKISSETQLVEWSSGPVYYCLRLKRTRGYNNVVEFHDYWYTSTTSMAMRKESLNESVHNSSLRSSKRTVASVVGHSPK